MPRSREKSEKEKQQRRKVLPGFPWEGKFRTREEIEVYFGDEKIQCLLCGKWYKQITNTHLSHIHDMTADEYRERYGLPWGRGLTGKISHNNHIEASKQMLIDGQIPWMDYQIVRETKPYNRPQRPPQPFAVDLFTRNLLTAHGRPITWQREDYEAILTRMQEQQRTLSDVLQDPDLPGENSWISYVKKHPEFATKLKYVYFSLPYSLQIRSGQVSPQFRIDCQRLRAQGMTLYGIADALGVSRTAVRNVLTRTKESSWKKLTIVEMHQLAKRRGGKCLLPVYINNRTRPLWECEKGHQWTAKPEHIKMGQWCPYCAGTIKEKIEEMRQIAENRGGKCLSETYINRRTKLLWECQQGHQWEATPANIKRGTWCPVWALARQGHTLRLSIEEMRQIAKNRGGKCLSETYINSHTKLLWECANSHQWEAVPSHIKHGSWCPFCANIIKRTIEEMRQIAENRGGKCLSETYINNRTKLMWQCEQGHQWETEPANIKSGKWCPVCARARQAHTLRLGIEKMRQIAKNRGGKCLSETYINVKTKLLWECAQGHQWEAAPGHIKYGSWCPSCARKKRGQARKGNQLLRNSKQ